MAAARLTGPRGRQAAVWAALCALLACATAPAARAPVLRQIALPHDYYFREMYLPRVTQGPGSLAWSPDGRELVYTMQGSLWRQALDSTVAEQLTAGPGYDLQPDWSARHGRVVFVRYDRDALELVELDPVTRAERALTTGGAVNVEPRWSPDGRRLAWVSTAGTGRFHVFVGDVTPAGLDGRAPWPERQSTVTRYYYSGFDHELSPVWSPDGAELIYVGNPEIGSGTGSLWRRGLAPDAQPVLVRSEETTWRARPDWARDGRRVIWSSYAGRQWHQLWTTTADGGEPLPLSYGDFDATQARWSPDGRRVAYISNASGTTAIRIRELVGGADRALEVRERRWLRPTGRLRLRTLDAAGAPVPARVAIVGADGRGVAPDGAWLHADDSFDRQLAAFETHYFHAAGEALLTLPAGAASVTVWRGPENAIARRRVTIAADGTATLAVGIEPLALPAGWAGRWQSGDVHVHMNYGGTYRNTPARLAAQAAAEDLDVVHNLIVNKEQRIPDIGYFSPLPDAASDARVLVAHAQEFHTGYWGHMGLLGLQEHYLLPDYAAYPGTAAASVYPTNGVIAALARAQGALVGYVHPYDVEPDPAGTAPLTHALPVNAALGLLDYFEVVGFSDHRATAAVWHRLLNCGLRIAAAGGTDAFANFASLRGPVGQNRVYVETEGGDAAPAPRLARWLEALRAGRSMATNGPLLGFTVEGQGPGGAVRLSADQATLRYEGFLRSNVAVDHLELIHDGKIVRKFPLRGTRMSADVAGSLEVTGPGWVLLRAWSDGADPGVFDIYPYATTSPVFIERDGATRSCGADADYFIAWIDRLRAAAAAHGAYNSREERDATLAELAAARAAFERRR